MKFAFLDLIRINLTVPGSKVYSVPAGHRMGVILLRFSGDSQKLMLYDFKTQKWAVWADEGHTSLS